MKIILAILFFMLVLSAIYISTLAVIVVAVGRLLGKISKTKKKFYDHRLIKYGAPILALICTYCILYGWLIEPYWFDVTKHTVETGKIPSDESVRIVHLSDLHLEEETDRERRLPELVNSLEPDIIVITGDFLNGQSGKPVLKNLLGKFNAKHGIYIVYGNFRFFYDPADVLRESGVTVLDDDLATADRVIKRDVNVRNVPLTIYGVRWERGRNIEKLAGKVDPSRINILLHHTPDAVESVRDVGFDMYLCGHTHGGQVRMPFYGALITLSKFGKKYEMGRYQVGDTMLYVNRGVGMEGGTAPRVRFLCRPEIAVFDLVK